MTQRKSLDELLLVLDERVRDALISLLPAHWKRACLTVSYHPIDKLRFQMPHTIGCLDGSSEAILDTDEKYNLDKLYGATGIHFDTCRRHKKMWRQARFMVLRLRDGSWKCTTDFSY